MRTFNIRLMAVSLLIAAFCLSPVTIANAVETGASSNNQNARIFADPAGYQLPVPEGWHLTDHTAKKHLIRADITQDKNTGVQIRLEHCDPGRFNKTAESSLQKYKQDMTRHWGGTCAEVKCKTITAGETTVIHGFRLKRKDGQDWYLQLALVYADGKIVVLQGGCPWNKRDAFSQTLARMAEGISFTDHRGRRTGPMM